MDRRAMDRRLAPLLGWIGLLAGVLLAMGAVGEGSLSAPPLTDPGGWAAWAASRGAPAAALSVVRLVLTATSAWLLLVTLVTTGLHLVGRGARLDVVDILGLPIVRRVVQGALGAGFVGATVAAVAPHGSPPPPVAVQVEVPELSPVGRRVPASTSRSSTSISTTSSTSSTSTTSTTSTTSIVPTATTTSTLFPTGVDGVLEGPPLVTSSPAWAAPPPLLPAPVAPSHAPVAPATWTVAPGEHFWSIAERVVTARAGIPSGGDAVGRYWSELVAANRDRLADPANPDLLFTGDVLVLPPVPSAR